MRAIAFHQFYFSRWWFRVGDERTQMKQVFEDIVFHRHRFELYPTATVTNICATTMKLSTGLVMQLTRYKNIF